VDADSALDAGASGAVAGAGGVLADGLLYHAGTELLNLPPEVAQSLARQGVAAGFCLLAIGVDVKTEWDAVQRGEASPTAGLSRAAFFTALDSLPLVVAPLGWVGIPLLIVLQMGGRSLAAQARERDARLAQAIAADMAQADRLEWRLRRLARAADMALADSATTDALYHAAMAGAGGAGGVPVIPKLGLKSVRLEEPASGGGGLGLGAPHQRGKHLARARVSGQGQPRPRGDLASAETGRWAGAGGIRRQAAEGLRNLGGRCQQVEERDA
jgi:hypothetical protein